MEKSNFFYLIFLVPLLFVASCKENDISPDTLPPITPSLKVEDAYKAYLDTVVYDISTILSESITPIFIDLVNAESARIEYKANLEQVNSVFNDSVNFPWLNWFLEILL